MNIIISSLPGDRRLQSVFVHCFFASRDLFTMQTAQNIRSKLKHTHTIYAMVAVNSESLGLLTRTGFAAEVQPQYQEAPNRIPQAAGSGGGG